MIKTSDYFDEIGRLFALSKQTPALCAKEAWRVFGSLSRTGRHGRIK